MQAAVLAVALLATTVVTAQVAGAQPVGNPGTVNFTIIGGSVRLGAQDVPLEPKEFPECSDGKNNDGDPLNPSAAQDLLVDFPADPQCTSALDNSEAASGFQVKQDTVFTGTVGANGSITIPQSGVVFPPQYVFAEGGVITALVQPTGNATGNVNPITGATTLQVPLRLKIEGSAQGIDLGGSCIVGPFTLNLRTGTTTPPAGFDPIVGVPYNPETGEATLVDNNFSVPGATGCGPLGAASGPLSAAFGLPSPAGVNRATLVTRATPKVTKGVVASNVPSVSTGIAPLTVNFNGTGSTAVKPIAAYEWDFTNDGTVDATGPTAFTTYSTPGTYQARLRVVDTDGDADTSIVTVTVNEPPNTPPVAAIGSSGTGGQAPYTVNFDGTGSSDPDGSIVGYAWDFGNDRTATTATGSATYTQPGTYTVTLTVTDNRGATGTTTREIVVTGAPNVAPNAVIRTVSVAGTIPLTVNLSGGNSNDPDGSIVGYNWDLGNGQTGTGAAIQAVYTEAGSYTVTLTVTDDRGATGTQTLVVDVSEDSNIAPGADFEADVVSGTAPLTVNFDGTASADVDGTIASYAWNFGNGQNGTGAVPAAATYTFPGTYTATLTVTDNKGATGTATKTITVTPPPNQSPSGSVSASTAVGNAPLLVQLSSAGSTDPDGAITAYSWNLGNGSTSTSPNPSAIYNSAGVYTVQLTVTDNQGATSVRSQTITVNPANVAPTAVIAANRFNGPSPLVVNFNGAGSSDPDGSIVSYAWNFGNGQTASGPLASATFAQGSYTVRLTVTDNRGTSRFTTVNIVAGATNVQPIARVTALPTAGPAPLLVSFSGIGSSDPDGSIISYSWNFGDGTSATGQVVQKTYTIFGTYTATLTVTDNRGATRTASETIVVDPPVPTRDRIRLGYTGGLNYSFDGATNGIGLRVQRDVFGVASVTGSAPYTGPGGSNATVSVNLSRFLIFNAYSGTITVNDPQNGLVNVTTSLFLSSLSSPSGNSARGLAAGTLSNPTRTYTLGFTIDDRAS
ncbi:MAG: PKD domain-containing protein [Microthrixaceae bacterium]